MHLHGRGTFQIGAMLCAVESVADLSSCVVADAEERDADIAWADVAAARSRLSVEEQGRTLLVVPQLVSDLPPNSTTYDSESEG